VATGEIAENAARLLWNNSDGVGDNTNKKYRAGNAGIGEISLNVNSFAGRAALRRTTHTWRLAGSVTRHTVRIRRPNGLDQAAPFEGNCSSAVVPFPGSLSSTASPPCIRMIAFTMARPSPAPSLRLSPASAR